MRKFLMTLLLTTGLASASAAAEQVPAASCPEITVVLVREAFATFSSWEAVIPKLVARSYTVIAIANPLRGLKTDADYIATVLGSIKGSIVLVGHSYGGSVITGATT